MARLPTSCRWPGHGPTSFAVDAYDRPAVIGAPGRPTGVRRSPKQEARYGRGLESIERYNDLVVGAYSRVPDDEHPGPASALLEELHVDWLKDWVLCLHIECGLGPDTVLHRLYGTVTFYDSGAGRMEFQSAVARPSRCQPTGSSRSPAPGSAAVPGRCPLTSRTFTSHTTEVRRRPCRTGTARMGLRLRSSLKRGQSRAGGGGTDHGPLTACSPGRRPGRGRRGGEQQVWRPGHRGRKRRGHACRDGGEFSALKESCRNGGVRCRRFSLRTWIACWRMSRSTRLRLTTTPPARSSAVIRLAPYVFPDSAWTLRIRRVSAASTACFAARAGAVFSHR